MASGFETWDLGRTIATAEGIQQMRRQSAFDTLREQATRAEMDYAKAREGREATTFSQEQQINGTRLLNAAAAEIAQDPSDEVIQRWLPQLQQAGIQFGANPLAVPPEVRQQYATKLFQSTSAALSALAPQKPTEEPTEIRTLRALQKEPELLALHKNLEAAGASNNSPANVQEWQYYSKLSPEQKKEYLEMKRSQQTFLPTIAQVPTVVRPGVAGNPTEVQPLTTLPEVSNAAATVAGAEAGAKTTETAKAEAAVNLQSNLDEIDKMEAGVKGLLTSPGFKTIYGLSGKIDPRNYTPGTEAANSEARRNQLEAASFGISIQKMKGLGQLSNAEGQKVTAAYTRAIDKRQSEESAREAWNEVLSYLELAKLRARQKAGGPAAPSSPPAEPQAEITATGPNGEKLILRNNQWVPAGG